MSGSGRCACGGVSYRVTGELRGVRNCHCERCRRITGHFMAASACATDDLRLDAAETLRWYTPDEEATVSYAFCGRCGSTLFWRSSQRPEVTSIAAGTLDPPTGLRTVDALFVADASDYHTLDSSIPGQPHDAP